MTPLWKRLAVVLLAPVLLGAQCSILEPGDDAGDLEGARQRWRAAGIDDYAFVLKRNCFCGDIDPVRIVVRDGQAVSWTVVPTGAALNADLRRWYPTVEGLFDFLEDAEDRNAFRIDVRYHDTLGYPVSAYVDYQENVADEELGYDVTSLEPGGT